MTIEEICDSEGGPLLTLTTTHGNGLEMTISDMRIIFVNKSLTRGQEKGHIARIRPLRAYRG